MPIRSAASPSASFAVVASPPPPVELLGRFDIAAVAVSVVDFLGATSVVVFADSVVIAPASLRLASSGALQQHAVGVAGHPESQHRRHDDVVDVFQQ